MNKEDLQVGKKYPTFLNGYIKILAFADSYYMARYKGCFPFCCKADELIDKIEKNQAL